MQSVKFQVNDTKAIEIEVQPTAGYQSTSTSHQEIVAAFDRVLDTIREVGVCFGSTAEHLMQQAHPSDIELTIGVKISAEGNVLIAKTGSEAQFAVKLTWKKSASDSK